MRLRSISPRPDAPVWGLFKIERIMINMKKSLIKRFNRVSQQSKLICLITFFLLINLYSATLISDSFDSLNTALWGCEYSCPNVSNGYARFTLQAGSLNTNATWSKLSFKNKSFSYGKYSMKFRYSRRPLEAEVWAGWALYTETSSLINEVNFGIETACKQRCNDQTLIFESYKNSINKEVIVSTGVNIVDNSWHTVEILYTPTKITLTFDGEKLDSIIDQNNIPAVPMKLIPGARVVSGTLSSTFYMDIDSIFIFDTIISSTSIKNNLLSKTNFYNDKVQYISIYNIAGKKIYSIDKSKNNLNVFSISNKNGVYIIQTKINNNIYCKKLLNINKKS